MVERFCPSCGKKTTAFLRGFCETCFRARHALAVSRVSPVEIPECRHCAKIRIHNRWLVFSEDHLRLFVERHLVSDFDDPRFTVALEPAGEKKWLAKVEGVVKVDDQPMNFAIDVPVLLAGGQCDSCMRIKSDYFEAKLQIRFSSSSDVRQPEILRRIDAYFDEARQSDSLADFQSVTPVKNGFDYQIGSKKAAGTIADKLVRDYSGQKTVSKKLHSFKDGKSEYRFTFLVRF